MTTCWMHSSAASTFAAAARIRSYMTGHVYSERRTADKSILVAGSQEEWHQARCAYAAITSASEHRIRVTLCLYYTALFLLSVVSDCKAKIRC